ncbi:MAG: class I tRNA ligase family protein, partial [Gammaproteobacteria bacterium]
DWYLEISKHNMNDITKNHLIFSILRIIKLCHPIIPFITENIWKEFYKCKFVSEKMLIDSSFPSQIRISKEADVEARVHSIKEIIKKIRKTRTELGIHPKEIISINVHIKKSEIKNDVTEHQSLIESMTNANIDITAEQSDVSEYIDLIDDNYTLYLKIRNMINVQEEMKRIDKKLIELEAIVTKINSKLNNKSFIEKAPSEIINQNISNKSKIENDILSLNNLRKTLSN